MLTRDDVTGYVEALAPIEIIAMPVTEQTATPEQHEALARAVTEPYAHTIVASRHAAIYLARAVTDRARLGEIWAVGPATHDALARDGFSARVPSVHDGEALARELIASRASLRGVKILAPRAADGRTDAIAMLRAAGADVTDVAAYRTHAIAADDPSVAAGRALLLANAALCCVFAPSQVTALAAIIGPLSGLSCCAIGETTAAALRSAGVARCEVAATPTPAGLAGAVRAMLATLSPA